VTKNATTKVGYKSNLKLIFEPNPS